MVVRDSSNVTLLRSAFAANRGSANLRLTCLFGHVQEIELLAGLNLFSAPRENDPATRCGEQPRY
jgi:hypothetical protein